MSTEPEVTASDLAEQVWPAFESVIRTFDAHTTMLNELTAEIGAVKLLVAAVVGTLDDAGQLDMATLKARVEGCAPRGDASDEMRALILAKADAVLAGKVPAQVRPLH